MLDPQEFRNIIHQDFTEVTSQEFLANQKKYCPEIFEGDNYPNITENLNNLAKLYQSQGRYATLFTSFRIEKTTIRGESSRCIIFPQWFSKIVQFSRKVRRS